MLKKVIKYEDFDGNQREEEFLFNLTKAELLELEGETDGGLDKRMKDIIALNDIGKTIAIMKKIILASYGEKIDGKFVKNQTIRESFAATQAYSDLFMELATNDEAASKFLIGIMPKDMNVDEAMAEANKMIANKKGE